MQLKESEIKLSALQENMDSKRAFVRFLGHEMRTPLNIVSTGLKLLAKHLRREEADIESLDLVGDALSACDAASHVLDDLLTFEIADHDELTLQMEEVSLLSLVRRTMRVFAVTVKESRIGLELESDLGSADAMLSADSGKLQQLLRNLLNNGIKFTPVGGSVVVSVSADETVGQAYVRVQDSSMGMSTDEKVAFNSGARSFDPKVLLSAIV